MRCVSQSLSQLLHIEQIKERISYTYIALEQAQHSTTSFRNIKSEIEHFKRKEIMMRRLRTMAGDPRRRGCCPEAPTRLPPRSATASAVRVGATAPANHSATRACSCRPPQRPCTGRAVALPRACHLACRAHRACCLPLLCIGCPQRAIRVLLSQRGSKRE